MVDEPPESAGRGGEPQPPSSTAQEGPAGAQEVGHGPLGSRIAAGLRSAARQAGTVGTKAAGTLGTAAEALRLEVVETALDGERALVGRVRGMQLLIPAGGVHFPRETPALVYLFRDAVAVRPTDDLPMSQVPLFGLHLVEPHLAIGRWVYKAGRTAMANIDLDKRGREVEESLASWTVDDFGAADAKVQVFRLADLAGPVHLYQHLGFVRLSFAVSAGKPVRLESALVESSTAFVRMWELFTKVLGPSQLTMHPTEGDEADPAAGGSSVAS